MMAAILFDEAAISRIVRTTCLTARAPAAPSLPLRWTERVSAWSCWHSP